MFLNTNRRLWRTRRGLGLGWVASVVVVVIGCRLGSTWYSKSDCCSNSRSHSFVDSLHWSVAISQRQYISRIFNIRKDKQAAERDEAIQTKKQSKGMNLLVRSCIDSEDSKKNDGTSGGHHGGCGAKRIGWLN